MIAGGQQRMRLGSEEFPRNGEGHPARRMACCVNET
jgi:hypothetical protein